MSSHRVFTLHPMPGEKWVYGKNWRGEIIITPELTSDTKVRIAWTHAVRFTAKGIDLADYDAAIKTLLEYHPSWTFLGEQVVMSVAVDLSIKDEDHPD